MWYLGVATTFDVEDTMVTPAVLVITDESTIWISRQRSLASSRKPKEKSDITILALVRRRVQGQDVVLNRHEIKHDGENALLHLAGILGPENDHLVRRKVDGHTRTRGHAEGVSVGGEGTGVVDGKVGGAVRLHLLLGGTYEHVAHKETVVGAGTHDTDLDSVAGVPAGVAVKDVDPGTGIEVVDGTLTVDLPDLFGHGLVDGAPPHVLGR